MNGLTSCAISASWILLCDKRKQTTDTCNNLDRFLENYAGWKKPVPKSCILCDPICTTSWNDKIIDMENIFVFAKDCRAGKGRKEDVPIKQPQEDPLW